MTSLAWDWCCQKCLSCITEEVFQRERSCPTCSGTEFDLIKPQIQRVITGIEREFGEHGVQK